jgi:hypothetical protein
MREEAILARWPGRCPRCGSPIARGELIVCRDGRWEHETCPRTPRAGKRKGRRRGGPP